MTKGNLTALLALARLGRFLAPMVAVTVYFLIPGGEAGLSDNGRATAAIMGLMAVLWLTEALPLPVTGLLPIILFPLAGVATVEQATIPYANKFIFLFMGGFMLALAIEKSNLHRRIALKTLLLTGLRPSRLIAGFMLITAFLSMWISNTASTLIMVPIGLSIVDLIANPSSSSGSSSTQRFGACMMLAIAWSATIGGLGTLTGTAPNLLLAAFLKETYGIEIGFGRWMLFGVPVVVVMLLVAWTLLTKWLYPLQSGDLKEGEQQIRAELGKLGPMTSHEKVVMIVFVLTALAWIGREPLTRWDWLIERVPAVSRLQDSTIGLLAALSLFAIPVKSTESRFALDWQTASKLPWGILLLFGGGLSLASAIKSSGLSDWIALRVSLLENTPVLLLVVLTTTLVIFLTELTSNTATASTFLPILGASATGLGVTPMLILLPAGLAASCAFMTPVATPPNAIIFGTGRVTIQEMIKAGLWLNLIGVVLLSILGFVVLQLM